MGKDAIILKKGSYRVKKGQNKRKKGARLERNVQNMGKFVTFGQPFGCDYSTQKTFTIGHTMGITLYREGLYPQKRDSRIGNRHQLSLN